MYETVVLELGGVDFFLGMGLFETRDVQEIQQMEQKYRLATLRSRGGLSHLAQNDKCSWVILRLYSSLFIWIFILIQFSFDICIYPLVIRHSY